MVLTAACAGRVNNRPADMPGSPAEAEAMQQDNSPDKAPPGSNEEPVEQPIEPALEPAEVGPAPPD